MLWLPPCSLCVLFYVGWLTEEGSGSQSQYTINSQRSDRDKLLHNAQMVSLGDISRLREVRTTNFKWNTIWIGYGVVPELDLVWLPAVYGESIVVVVVVCMIFFPTLTLYHYVFCLFLPYMCMRPFKFVLLFCYNFSVISHLFLPCM